MIDKNTHNRPLQYADVIGDNDIFVLNPMFRLRNERKYVLLFGNQDIGLWRLHHTYGITLALCDGNRTVAEIAKIVSAFVKTESSEDAVSQAKNHVKFLFYWMMKSKKEQSGLSHKSLFQSDAPLILKSDFEHFSDKLKYFHVIYNPQLFLPFEKGISSHSDMLIHESAPHTLNWHLTSECVTDCKYCYLGRRKTKLLSKERHFELLEEAEKIGVLSIHLNGGDVLLSPYLFGIRSRLPPRLLKIDLSDFAELS